jgi:hypothetical protein
MLNEKVFKPPSLVAEITDSKISLFDYEPRHRGIYVSRTFDIPHQITVTQTNFPRIRFADEKTIGAILYVLDDGAPEVLTAMNIYDSDYSEYDLDSLIADASNKVTSENEDIKEIAEDDYEVEDQNDDDVAEEQLVRDDNEPSFVNDIEFVATEEQENLVENDLLAESCSENTDDNTVIDVVETENALPEMNSIDEDEDEDNELAQEDFEEQEDEIESDSCDSEIEAEFIDQEEIEEQEINFDSSPISNTEIDPEEMNESFADFATDDSVIDFTSNISSAQQAEDTEILPYPEDMPNKQITGVSTLLEKLSMFAEERKRTPYLTSQVNAEADISSSEQTSSEAETLRGYSLIAPAA